MPKVNFDKFYEMFPNFSLEYSLETGMKELASRLIDFEFSEQDFDGDQFVRLKMIAKKLELIS